MDSMRDRHCRSRARGLAARRRGASHQNATHAGRPRAWARASPPICFWHGRGAFRRDAGRSLIQAHAGLPAASLLTRLRRFVRHRSSRARSRPGRIASSLSTCREQSQPPASPRLSSPYAAHRRSPLTAPRVRGGHSASHGDALARATFPLHDRLEDAGPSALEPT
jgi:hypothetical protein